MEQTGVERSSFNAPSTVVTRELMLWLAFTHSTLSVGFQPWEGGSRECLVFCLIALHGVGARLVIDRRREE